MSESAPSERARLVLGAMESAVRDHVATQDDLLVSSVELRPGPHDLVVKILHTGPRSSGERREVTLVLSETCAAVLDETHRWTGGGGPYVIETHSEIARDLATVASCYLHGGGTFRTRRSWSALGRRREYLVFDLPGDELWFRLLPGRRSR